MKYHGDAMFIIKQVTNFESFWFSDTRFRFQDVKDTRGQHQMVLQVPHPLKMSNRHVLIPQSTCTCTGH